MDSVEALATQLVNAQGLIGNSIRIPSENASDEDRAKFRQTLLERVPGLSEVNAEDPEAYRATMRQLGAPEDATGYRLPELPEGLEPVDGFNEWAHEAALTQAQFETIAKRFTEASVAGAEQQMAAHNAEMEALHREWGYAYEQNNAAALGAAKLTKAPEDFIEAMEAGRVSANWVRYFATLAENYTEADIDDGGRRQQQAEMTPAEAQAQINEIMANKEHHPYWTAMPGTPEKQAAMELLMKLRHRAMGRSGRDVVAEVGQPEDFD